MQLFCLLLIHSKPQLLSAGATEDQISCLVGTWPQRAEVGWTCDWVTPASLVGSGIGIKNKEFRVLDE